MTASEVPMQSGIRTSSGDAGQPKTYVKEPGPGQAQPPDPEQAGQKSRQRAGCDQQKTKFSQLLHVEPGNCHDCFPGRFLIPNKPFYKSCFRYTSEQHHPGRVNDCNCRPPV